MKKMISFILAVFILFTAMPSGFAASGDIAGKIYATDIKTCINGVWVDSYNIGGKTVVVVEDITRQHQYWNETRTLTIYDFNPEELVSGDNSSNKKPGTVIGNIYESDIKTYFRGKELTAYSLDGKMAVVVEELGDDNTFSEIGGRYVWNDSLRTLTLESMHRYPYSMRNMMEDKGYNIILKETDYTYALEAEPVAAPLTGGHILCEKEIPANSIIRVTYDGETIGYRCSFALTEVETDENGVYTIKERQSPVDYFYVDKVEDMIFRAGVVTPTVDDWLSYYKNHTLSNIIDSFETDEYMFLYMFQSAFMSGTESLIKLNKADGTKVNYADEFVSVSLRGQKRFDSVEIDRENEKVYVHYDKDYVIDLKTDEVRVYNKLETDIGIGSSDGQPSEYEQTLSRNGQHEYKLISGDGEKIVKCISAHEYYYGYMFPIKETFDFFNIKYSFENDILIIDTSEAKPLRYERVEGETGALGDMTIDYLYVKNVLLNGEETEITYEYISGHFENMHTGRAKAKPYVVDGKVYINDSFIRHILGAE